MGPKSLLKVNQAANLLKPERGSYVCSDLRSPKILNGVNPGTLLSTCFEGIRSIAVYWEIGKVLGGLLQVIS